MLLLGWVSSIVVVVKDWRGKLVCAHSKKANTHISLQVEAEATIILALNITTKFNASHFAIESDSKICIDSIRALVNQVPWRLLSFVLVGYIFVDLGSISFSWDYHEVNLVAHELAKWSCSHFYFGSFGLGHCPHCVEDVFVKEVDPFV